MRLFRFDETAFPPTTTEYQRESIEESPEFTEDDLESWLHANPSVLLPEPIVLFARQPSLSSGAPDLLGLDEFGNVVIFELKVGESGSGSASEGTILSQPKFYAQALSDFSYEDLDDLYQNYRVRYVSGAAGNATEIDRGETLQEAFAATFGGKLPEDEYNTYQRMVILVEEITKRTADNTRYRVDREQQLYQCVEVQWFTSPQHDSVASSESFLTSSMVVDYDRARVRPPSRPNPTYPDLTREIVEACFPSIQELVHAGSIFDVFPDGFDERRPSLVSRHPDHPEGVRYILAVTPDKDEVLLTLDNLADSEDVIDRIQSNRGRFLEEDFTVKDNPRYRLVEAKWTVESTDDVRANRSEIAERFSALVRIGHDVLIDLPR